MIESYAFLKAILDSVTEQMAVIDEKGVIVFVNQSWISFGVEHHGMQMHWENVNYLDVCDKAAATGDAFSLKATKGIRKVIKTEKSLFYFEYPCKIDTQKLWFMMRVTPLKLLEKNYFVISHQNITQRKRAEDKVLRLSKIDSLTKLPNHRYFNQFLKYSLKQCSRLNTPLSLAIIDIDYFKCVNDTFGHLKGDEYLAKIGAVIKNVAKRPSDLSSRYGGEEFAIILGNTPLEPSIVLMNKLLNTIQMLNIPNPNSLIMPTVTASIGLITLYPNAQTTANELIKKADDLLYQAKDNGRNQLAYRKDS